MKIAHFARRPRRYKKHQFDDLPLEERWRAEGWLGEFCRRWKGDLPTWRLAILAGQARRLARTSPEQRSQWGRTMLAKRGGYAVQRSYVVKGRTGAKHPAHRAARVSASRRRLRKEERVREALGEPPKPGVKWLEIG